MSQATPAPLQTAIRSHRPSRPLSSPVVAVIASPRSLNEAAILPALPMNGMSEI